MNKIVNLIKFLSNKGFKKESLDLSSAYNEIFEEEESSFIEELCNKDILVTIDISFESKYDSSKDSYKYNYYKAKVSNPFFKNMNISFTDKHLRYLDEKNYFTLDIPSLDTEEDFDKFDIQYDAYKKRKDYLDKESKEFPPEETKAVIIKRVKQMIVDFMIKFQSLLCSTRNKDIISSNKDVYEDKIIKYLDREIDIRLGQSFDSSSISMRKHSDYIDLNYEIISSPKDAEYFMKQFVRTLYHEVGHSFSDYFNLKDYKKIRYNEDYQHSGFKISFPKREYTKNLFYKDFFEKFYNLNTTSFIVNKERWEVIIEYLKDYNYGNLFEINFYDHSDEDYDEYKMDIDIECEMDNIPEKECKYKTKEELQKDLDESTVKKIVEVLNKLKINYSSGERSIPLELKEFKGLVKALKEDDLVNEWLMSLMSSHNIDHVADYKHLSMMTRQLYSFADREAGSVSAEQYEDIFYKLLSLEYPKDIYLNNPDLIRAVMLFYGNPEANSKALLKFMRSVKLDSEKSSVPV